MATRIGDEEDGDPRAERLRELHEGRHPSDGNPSVRESQRDKRRIAQAICSALPLADYEREIVVENVECVDMTRFGHQKSITRVTLGPVAVIVDQRLRSDVQCYEYLVSRSDEFRSLQEHHDISMTLFQQ
ncbi:hypothetical protein [Halalkalicoccus tibetensis]|uniref:Uncharacterized protein n=1 Tax=Halalkalicoccus tibetensis TaxID=175632 RepID=A0ABD5VAB0_9EURY